jgi:hypothetical protein
MYTCVVMSKIGEAQPKTTWLNEVGKFYTVKKCHVGIRFEQGAQGPHGGLSFPITTVIGSAPPLTTSEFIRIVFYSVHYVYAFQRILNNNAYYYTLLKTNFNYSVLFVKHFCFVGCESK